MKSTKRMKRTETAMEFTAAALVADLAQVGVEASVTRDDLFAFGQRGTLERHLGIAVRWCWTVERHMASPETTHIAVLFVPSLNAVIFVASVSGDVVRTEMGAFGQHDVALSSFIRRTRSRPSLLV